MFRFNMLMMVTALSGSVCLPVQGAEETNVAYQNAYQYVIQERWPEAIEYFERFAREWPDSALLDNANYWNCFSREREFGPGEQQLECYQEFLEQWQTSEWRDEVRDRLTLMASRLRDFDEDEDERERVISIVDNDNEIRTIEVERGSRYIVDRVGQRDRVIELATRARQEAVRAQENAMRQLEQQLARMREGNSSNEGIMEVREAIEEVRRNLNNVQLRLRMNREVDSELLSVLSALRDDPRAAELLVDRLRQSNDPAVKARIVLMLEDFESPEVNEALLELASEFSEEPAQQAVQRNAIDVLLDRELNSNTKQVLLRNIVTSDQYPVDVRADVISRISRWDLEGTEELLGDVLSSETNVRLAGAAARSLRQINTSSSRSLLMDRFEEVDNLEIRRSILEQINVREAPEMMTFLRDLALSDEDPLLTSAAVSRIAYARNEISVSVLQDIYVETNNTDLQVAIIRSLRSTRIPETVAFIQELINSNPDNEQLGAAVSTLDRMNMRETIPIFIEIYENSENSEIRSNALSAIQQFDELDESTRDFLLRVLEERLDSVGSGQI